MKLMVVFDSFFSYQVLRTETFTNVVNVSEGWVDVCGIDGLQNYKKKNRK